MIEDRQKLINEDFSMSKEDNISKLFRDNQDAFEKEPSGDLWERIASKRRAIIVEKEGTYSLIMRLSIAASFLLFMTVALVIRSTIQPLYH